MATKYVMAFVGGTMPETEEEQAALMAKWTAWFGSLGEAVVDPGNPFGQSFSISSDGEIGATGGSGLTGYTVISADNIESAKGMVKGCPILEDGGSIDVYETIEM